MKHPFDQIIDGQETPTRRCTRRSALSATVLAGLGFAWAAALQAQEPGAEKGEKAKPTPRKNRPEPTPFHFVAGIFLQKIVGDGEGKSS